MVEQALQCTSSGQAEHLGSLAACLVGCIVDKPDKQAAVKFDCPPIWSQLHLLHDILQADKIAHIKANGVLELLCCRVCTSEGCQWASYKDLAAPCHQPDQC